MSRFWIHLFLHISCHTRRSCKWLIITSSHHILTSSRLDCYRPMTWSDIQLKVQNHLYFAHTELYCDCRNCLSTLQAFHPDAMKTIPSIVQDLKQLMSAYNVDV